MRAGDLEGQIDITNTVHEMQAKGKEVTFRIEGPPPCPRTGYFTAKANGALDSDKQFGIKP